MRARTSQPGTIGNVGSLGGTRANATGSSRPSAASQAPDATINIPLPGGDNFELTRRQLVLGAIGTGALVVAGVAGASISDATSNDDEIKAIEVGEDEVFSLSDCTALDDVPLTLVGEYQLPYGTLVWANCDSAYAACLLPTETSTPLAQVALLALANGTYTTVLEGPVSTERGFDVYEARCNDNGMVWTESNCYTGQWRIYQAALSRGVLGQATMVDSGDSQWDVPQIAVAGSRAFWQVMPAANGDMTSESSVLRSAEFGSEDVRVDITSNGRMADALYSTGDGVVAVPRNAESRSYYDLALVDAASGQTQNSLTLPASMKPLEAGYVNGRFTFAFDSIYSYGEGLASLGTYTTEGTDAAGMWFCFDRNPYTAPAWCDEWLIVKSTRAVAGVNLTDRTTFSLPCPDDCDDYGDFLATTGTGDTIVTYLGMAADDTDEDSESYTLVRVWSV